MILLVGDVIMRSPKEKNKIKNYVLQFKQQSEKSNVHR